MSRMIEKFSFLISAAIFCCLSFSPTSAQELNTSVVINGERIEVRLEPRDVDCLKLKQIQMGTMFCAAVILKSPNEALLKEIKLKSFDAVMPDHRHGMVTRPKIKDSKTGEYLIEGLKLHMPGEWKFSLELLHGKTSAQVAIPLKL